MDDQQKLKAFIEKLQIESGKTQAAQCMVDAKMKEMEASIHLNDWAAVERARYACVGAYEHLLDARIGAIRHLKNEVDKL